MIVAKVSSRRIVALYFDEGPDKGQQLLSVSFDPETGVSSWSNDLMLQRTSADVWLASLMQAIWEQAYQAGKAASK